MPPKRKAERPKTAAERMRDYRARQRAKGLRPVQRWVRDLRNPKVREEIRRQAALLDKHPETEAINAWLDAMLEDRERERGAAISSSPCSRAI